MQAKGLAKGLTGLATTPIQEMRAASKSGNGRFAGFMKGVGKGIIGVAVKPAVGAMDLAEGVSAGIRNTAAMIQLNGQEAARG